MSDSLDWHVATTFPFEGRGWTDTARLYERLPARAEGIVREPVWRLARMSAGLCLRFVSNARTIAARCDLLFDELSAVHMSATGYSGLDLYAQDARGVDRWVGAFGPAANPAQGVLADGLTSGLRRFTLYLPLFNSPVSLEIGVTAGATIEPFAPRAARPICFYGTSIVHGASASRAGMAIPAILGRRLRRPVLNLGLAGNGKMEPEVADLLAELDPCVYVVDCLPNMVAAQIEERAPALVRRLRQARPDAPVLLVEDRTYANARFCPAKVERHRSSRAALRAAFTALTAAGVTHVHYLAGDGLLPDDGEATVDSSHPTDLGMVAYADAYEPVLRSILQGR